MTNFTRIIMDHDVFPENKKGVHTALQRRDTYMLNNERFQATDFEHGRNVDAFTSYTDRAHHFAVSGTLIIGNFQREEIVWARIERIRMMDSTLFTDEDYQHLGFENEEQRTRGLGAFYAGKVWVMDITPIDPDKP